MKKINDFHFKTFSIIQQKSAMKVNTDSVILGAFTKYSSPKTALDIGTGTGLLALMLAHKYPKLIINAIDIDKNSIEEAELNFKNSQWNNRLKANNIALQNFTPDNKYDIIITNPPYFINSSKNKLDTKTTARHTDNLSFEEIISFALSFLSKDGVLSLILPKTESEIFENEAIKQRLNLTEKLLIKPFYNKEVNRVVMQFKINCNKENVLISNLSVYEKQNKYSVEHHELTKEYYLDKF